MKEYTIAILIAAIILKSIINIFYPNYTIIVYNTTFLSPIWMIYVSAICGIIFWLCAVKLFVPWLSGISNLYLYIGSHTFSLMMHQGLAGIILNSLFFKIGIIDSSRKILFYHFIWFNVNNCFNILYPILIPIIILVPVYLFEKIKKSYKNKCSKAILE